MAKKINFHKLYAIFAVFLVIFLLFLFSKGRERNDILQTQVETPVTTKAEQELKSGDTFTSQNITSFKETGKKFFMTLVIPKDWTVERYWSQDESFSLTLSKNGAVLSIGHSDTYDSADCSFVPVHVGDIGRIYYPNYIQFVTQFGTIRMPKLKNPDNNYVYMSCQQITKGNSNWSSFTEIGSIGFEIPKKMYNDALLKEMENILKQVNVTYQD